MSEKEATIALLRECSDGVETGVLSIEEALKHAHSEELKETLNIYKKEHERIRDEIQAHLKKCTGGNIDEAEAPTLSTSMAKSMAKFKINIELAFNERDTKVAELMSEGCEMGSRTLTQEINRHQEADKTSKNIAGTLVRIEDELCSRLRRFL